MLSEAAEAIGEAAGAVGEAVSEVNAHVSTGERDTIILLATAALVTPIMGTLILIYRSC